MRQSTKRSSNVKFYVRDNVMRRWLTGTKGHPIQFTFQRSAKRFADKSLRHFLIISFNTNTRMIKWRGGERGNLG